MRIYDSELIVYCIQLYLIFTVLGALSIFNLLYSIPFKFQKEQLPQSRSQFVVLWNPNHQSR